MSLADEVIARAKGSRRVVLPEADDDRILKAADKIVAQGIAEPVFLADDFDPEPLAAAIAAARPGMKPALAARMLSKPVIRAAAMVGAGQAEALVAGAATPSRRVIEAAGLAIGMAEGVSVPSSFFLMQVPGRTPLFFADCALNVAPAATELAGIAVATARSAEALTRTPPRVAMLSFSTYASGTGDSVDLVRTAFAEAREAAPDLSIDGPLQADAALSEAIAVKKGAVSDVAGRANVLIFPTLDAGNIGYKLVQELAGSQAVGPFLQGFRRPVCDLSRGASVDDIVAATAVTLALG